MRYNATPPPSPVNVFLLLLVFRAGYLVRERHSVPAVLRDDILPYSQPMIGARENFNTSTGYLVCSTIVGVEHGSLPKQPLR